MQTWRRILGSNNEIPVRKAGHWALGVRGVGGLDFGHIMVVGDRRFRGGQVVGKCNKPADATLGHRPDV